MIASNFYESCLRLKYLDVTKDTVNGFNKSMSKYFAHGSSSLDQVDYIGIEKRALGDELSRAQRNNDLAAFQDPSFCIAAYKSKVSELEEEQPLLTGINADYRVPLLEYTKAVKERSPDQVDFLAKLLVSDVDLGDCLDYCMGLDIKTIDRLIKLYKQVDK